MSICTDDYFNVNVITQDFDSLVKIVQENLLDGEVIISKYKTHARINFSERDFDLQVLKDFTYIGSSVFFSGHNSCFSTLSWYINYGEKYHSFHINDADEISSEQIRDMVLSLLNDELKLQYKQIYQDNEGDGEIIFKGAKVIENASDKEDNENIFEDGDSLFGDENSSHFNRAGLLSLSADDKDTIKEIETRFSVLKEYQAIFRSLSGNLIRKNNDLLLEIISSIKSLNLLFGKMNRNDVADNEADNNLLPPSQDLIFEDSNDPNDIFSDSYIGLPIPDYVEPTVDELVEDIKRYSKEIKEYTDDFGSLSAEVLMKKKDELKSLFELLNNSACLLEMIGE